jgi:hypothetical protein
VPIPLQILAHLTAWSVEKQLRYGPIPHQKDPRQSKPVDDRYSLTLGKLHSGGLTCVAPPTKRETASTWLMANARGDITVGGASLPLLPAAFNEKFAHTDAFDH